MPPSAVCSSLADSSRWSIHKAYQADVRWTSKTRTGSYKTRNGTEPEVIDAQYGRGHRIPDVLICRFINVRRANHGAAHTDKRTLTAPCLHDRFPRPVDRTALHLQTVLTFLLGQTCLSDQPSTTLRVDAHNYKNLYCISVVKSSLVPRPSPSFPSLTVLQATGSWARAWEQGYVKSVRQTSVTQQFAVARRQSCTNILAA